MNRHRTKKLFRRGLMLLILGITSGNLSAQTTLTGDHAVTGTLDLEDQLTVEDTAPNSVPAFLFGAYDDPLNPGTLIGGFDMQYDGFGNLDYILRDSSPSWTWWTSEPDGSDEKESMKLDSTGSLVLYGRNGSGEPVESIMFLPVQGSAGGKITIDGANVLLSGIDGAVSWGVTTPWGGSATAEGLNATAWGDSVANGILSTAWGLDTAASNWASTAWGDGASASDHAATAWGSLTSASGDAATAWGDGSVASGYLATAWGYQSEATNYAATAWGERTIADGQYSSSWGYVTSSLSDISTSWGHGTVASAYGATALGYFTKAEAPFSLALGTANVGLSSVATQFPDGTDAVIEVGNGTYNEMTQQGDRANSFTFFNDGKFRAAGVIESKAGVRVPQQGDLSMGDFTAGTDPATLDPALGLLYPVP